MVSALTVSPRVVNPASISKTEKVATAAGILGGAAVAVAKSGAIKGTLLTHVGEGFKTIASEYGLKAALKTEKNTVAIGVKQVISNLKGMLAPLKGKSATEAAKIILKSPATKWGAGVAAAGIAIALVARAIKNHRSKEAA